MKKPCQLCGKVRKRDSPVLSDQASTSEKFVTQVRYQPHSSTDNAFNVWVSWNCSNAAQIPHSGSEIDLWYAVIHLWGVLILFLQFFRVHGKLNAIS